MRCFLDFITYNIIEVNLKKQCNAIKSISSDIVILGSIKLLEMNILEYILLNTDSEDLQILLALNRKKLKLKFLRLNN